jgi:molybdenum cofactor cytidylyltransferase
MADAKLIGVLLAAGRSTRMGRPKQLLPWPPARTVGGPSEADYVFKSSAPLASETPATGESKPLVAAAFDAISSCCDEMIVVVGHEAVKVIAALADRKFEAVFAHHGELYFTTAPMIYSIKMGLFRARRIEETADVLLQPADHPEVRRATIEQIINQAAADVGRAVMPQYLGKGGHPVLIPSNLVGKIIEPDGPSDLRQFWLDRPELCVRLLVDDPSVVYDVDTPLDYDLRRRIVHGD